MNCIYPNLAELVQYHPYSIGTFADHANVTLEVFKGVLNNREELAVDEALNLAHFCEIPFGVLTSHELSMITAEDRDAQQMIDELSARANCCDSTPTIDAVKKLREDFDRGLASYCQLRAAAARVEFAETEMRFRQWQSGRRASRLSRLPA